MIPAYQPPSRYKAPHKPQRGVHSPLKATLSFGCLVAFFGTVMLILVLHTNAFYNHLSIVGWQPYTVQAGDTLGSLAEKFDPVDYQGTVQQAIEKENHMSISAIRAGEVIQVPVVGRKLP